jgi:hypothetical protein
MSSKESTPSVPPVTTPVNPAKGNKRGQTTLAAEIDRWQALADNLAPQVDQGPGLQEPFAQFQALLAAAKAARNQLNMLRAAADTALTQRNQLLADGGALFSRLSLGLQSIHGPRNPRLREFGLKPRPVPTGRPRKTPTPTPPPATEVTTTPVTPATPMSPAIPASPAK